jgi:hypothetical protein
VRVSFVTAKPVLDIDGALYSPIASLRREILLPARCLAAQGIQTHVISLASWPREEALRLLAKSHCVVFGKLFEDPARENDRFAADAASYTDLLASVDLRGRSAFCFADDHFDAPCFEDFYRRVAELSRVWICSSTALAETAQRFAKCAVRVYPEPTELPAGTPRVPQRRWRGRFAVWVARRSHIGLDPWRLRLLWFGHPSNVLSLIGVLPELRTVARDIPVALECVTQPGTELDQLATPASIGSAAELRLEVSAWSLEYMPSALEACDAVLLPQRVNDPAKRSKSNNRLVDALNAGRFCVAHPIPSYEQLRDYAWVGDSIETGLRWLLQHPAQAQQCLIAGQQYIREHHSAEALADFWLTALDLSL